MSNDVTCDQRCGVNSTHLSSAEYFHKFSSVFLSQLHYIALLSALVFKSLLKFQGLITHMDPSGGQCAGWNATMKRSSGFTDKHWIKHSALNKLHSSTSSRDKIRSGVGGRSETVKYVWDRFSRQKNKGVKHREALNHKKNYEYKNPDESAAGEEVVLLKCKMSLSNPLKPLKIRAELHEMIGTASRLIRNISHLFLPPLFCCGPPPSVCSHPSASSAPPLAPPAASAEPAAPPVKSNDVKGTTSLNFITVTVKRKDLSERWEPGVIM